MSVEPCFNLNLRQASRVMNQIYDRHLARCSLKTSQFSILRTLFFLREASQKTLQEALVLEQTTLTRNLRPLIRDGYLQVRRGSDRRERLVSLTASGNELLQRAEACWNQAQEDIRQRLGGEFTEDLLRVSQRVVALKN